MTETVADNRKEIAAGSVLEVGPADPAHGLVRLQAETEAAAAAGLVMAHAQGATAVMPKVPPTLLAEEGAGTAAKVMAAAEKKVTAAEAMTATEVMRTAQAVMTV